MLQLKYPHISGWYVAKVLSPCTNASAVYKNNSISISWTDPDDIIIKDQVIAKWSGTRLVRKEGSFPENENDGVLVLDSRTHNKYSDDPYVDEDGTKDSKYCLFPYSTRLIFNKSERTRVQPQIGEHTIKVKYDGKEETLVVGDGVKPDLSQYEIADSTGHEFDRWNKEIEFASEDTEYEAVYKNIVRFYKDSTNLFETEQVSSGSASTMSKTPVLESSNEYNYEFKCWTDEWIEPGQTAKPYGKVSPNGEILDSWEEIGMATADGVYRDVYKIGNYKHIDLGSTYGEVDVEIVAFDADRKGSLTQGTLIPITWISKQVIKGSCVWNSSGYNRSGYMTSELANTVNLNIFIQSFPKDLFPIIEMATKSYVCGPDLSGSTQTGAFSAWVPSVRELNFSSAPAKENDGPVYSERFSNDESRKAPNNSNGTYTSYWTRSAFTSTDSVVCSVSASGACEGSTPSATQGIRFGFCTKAGTAEVSGGSEVTSSSKLGNITEDTDFYAYYTTSPREYQITVNYNGTTKVLTLPYGTDLDLSEYEVADSTGHEFDHWDTSIVQVTEDKTYTAIYKRIITYYKNDSDIFEVEQVKYGTDALMADTPTLEKSQSHTYEFDFWADEWEAPEGYVVGGSGILVIDPETREIKSTWEEIAKTVDDGTYLDQLQIGDWKSVNFGDNYGTEVPMEIVAFDTDEKTSGDFAPITWISKNTLKGEYAWKLDSFNIGGYPQSDIKATVDTVGTSIVGTDTPAPYVIAVNKTYRMGAKDRGDTNSDSFSYWIPSLYELYGLNGVYSGSNICTESNGVFYSEKFTDNASRIKTDYSKDPEFLKNVWWLRTANYGLEDMAYAIDADGKHVYPPCNMGLKLVLGFCTGGTGSSTVQVQTFA